MRSDARVGTLLWWSCQSSVAHSCGLLNHLNSFQGRMFKLNAKFCVHSDSLLYLLSHFECDGHTAHMLKQWHLPPPLTSTVKLSLFTHAHSSPLSLAARLHWCQTNHTHYINRQTLYICLYVHTYIHTCIHTYIHKAGLGTGWMIESIWYCFTIGFSLPKPLLWFLLYVFIPNPLLYALFNFLCC